MSESYCPISIENLKIPTTDRNAEQIGTAFPSAKEDEDKVQARYESVLRENEKLKLQLERTKQDKPKGSNDAMWYGWTIAVFLFLVFVVPRL